MRPDMWTVVFLGCCSMEPVYRTCVDRGRSAELSRGGKDIDQLKEDAASDKESRFSGEEAGECIAGLESGSEAEDDVVPPEEEGSDEGE